MLFLTPIYLFILSELVLKVRVADSDDPDFIEIDLQKAQINYSYLLTTCCKEMAVNPQMVERIRFVYTNMLVIFKLCKCKLVFGIMQCGKTSSWFTLCGLFRIIQCTGYKYFVCGCISFMMWLPGAIFGLGCAKNMPKWSLEEAVPLLHSWLQGPQHWW